MRGKVEKVVKEMMEGAKTTISTKRALLSEVDALAAFLGGRCQYYMHSAITRTTLFYLQCFFFWFDSSPSPRALSFHWPCLLLALLARMRGADSSTIEDQCHVPPPPSIPPGVVHLLCHMDQPNGTNFFESRAKPVPPTILRVLVPMVDMSWLLHAGAATTSCCRC